MRGAYLDPSRAEQRQAIKYAVGWSLVGIFLFWVVAFFYIPLVAWVGGGLTDLSADQARQIFAKELHSPFSVFSTYGTWLLDFIVREPVHTTWTSFFKWRGLFLPILMYIGWFCYFVFWNPYEYRPLWYGDTAEATVAMVKKMGLFAGKFLCLGVFNKKRIRMIDQRSCFCIGVPACGKTTGVVIPNILMADNASLFIHDPNHDIAKLTSGYRATKGPVFVMNFKEGDQPEKGVYYPCWNPLNEDNMPPKYKGRDSYIATLIDFLIPNGPEGTDPYWVKSGRACLTGLTLYITNKVEQAKANDYFVARLADGKLDAADVDVILSFYQSMQQTDEVKRATEAAQKGALTLDNYVPIGTWEPVAGSWIGKEASFGMLLDMLNNWMFTKQRELKQRQRDRDIAAMNLDVWQMILDTMVNETFFYGYGRRALIELNQVLSLPDKQRASVLSVAQTGIEAFKNSAIRAKTSSNDFTYKQIRGVKNPQTGKMEPITFYVDHEGGNVCSLFINMVVGYLMEFGPNERDSGPYPVEFILDDFGRMPKLQIIADAIAFGRSKMNTFLIVVQDWHQIVSKYDENTSDIIMNAVGATLVKRQSNVETRNKITGKIMNASTRRVETGRGGDAGWGKSVNWMKHKQGTTLIKDSVIGGSGILNMAIEKQLVLVTGYANRPFYATTPLYYKDPELKKMTEIKPSPFVPKYILDERLKNGMPLDIQLDSLTGIKQEEKK